MDNKNLDSTTYDVKAITNYDRRFEAGKKDAIFFHVLGGAASVIAVVLAFVFGTCDPSEMIYFLGMPLWWTGGVIVYLAMFAIGMIHLKKSRTYSMLPREPKEEVNDK